MHKTKRLYTLGAASVLLSVASFSVSASDSNEEHGTFMYNFVQLGYANSETPHEEATGSDVLVSVGLNDHFRLRAGHTALSDDVNNIDETIVTLGLGYHRPVAHNTDMVFDAIWLRETVDDGLYEYSENGYALELGIRHFLMPKLELEGAIEYEEIDIYSDTFVKVATVYEFNHSFGLGASYKDSSDTSMYSIFGQLYF